MVPNLSEDVINQIKKFKHSHSYNVFDKLTQEQKLLVDELIPDNELKERYISYGLCEECSQPNTGKAGIHAWCQFCNSKHFQQDFNKWTSGNKEIDEFIQNFQLNATCSDEVLEWIPYEKFKNIEYLAKGGFSIVRKAEWIDGGYIQGWNIDQNKWERNSNYDVALKYLNNSQNITTKFLREVTFHKKLRSNELIVSCYGISQDPETKNFIMVMNYIENGSISQLLKNKNSNMSLHYKLELFYTITIGLKEIHNKGFIHKDLHSGNILNRKLRDSHGICLISDLGLCRPVNDQTNGKEKKIYGVLPYVAPEVLKGKVYTQAADIYSFGILVCELLSELPPYHDLPHDEFLASKICQGLRPKFDNIKVPQLLEQLIDQCLDADPSKRPSANELSDIFNEWKEASYNSNTEFYKQYFEVEEFNKSSKSNTSSTSYTTHSQAIYCSRLLDYKDLPEPQNSKEINSLQFDFGNF